ncbi:hypothetical protein BGZ82_002999, partial [Podila clonocystis]
MNYLPFDTLCADFEDVLPSDLFDKVSKLLHASYLQESPASHQTLIRGIVWSASMRPIISLPVQLSGAITTMSTRKPLHVHFLYLEACPQTYLSEEAMHALGLDNMVVVGEPEKTDSGSSPMRLPLLLNGYKVAVAKAPAESHFAHLNMLGNDFARATGAQVRFAPPHGTSKTSATATQNSSTLQEVDVTSVAYPANAQAQGKWYIQGGFFLVGHTATYALDLTVPWKSSSAPWTQLPDSPDLSATSCVVSLNNTFSFPAHKQVNKTSPVLAIVGSETAGQPFLALLDVSTRTWIVNATKVNAPKRNSGLVAIGNPIDGKIYTRGGYQSDLCDTMDVYDPKTDTLQPISIPQPSAGVGDISTGGVGVPSSQWYGAVWSNRRSSILYFGGRLGTSSTFAPAVIYEYIPATNTWSFLSTTGAGPGGREDPCMAIDEVNDNIVVYGGQITEGLLGDIYVLDLNTLVWKRGPSSTDGRVGMACTIYDDGFLVWGGAKDTFLLNVYSPEPGVFNLTTQQWTSTYKMTVLPETTPTDKSKGSTLGLVLGLTMGGIAVGAVSIGMFLYKREKKKSGKSTVRLQRIADKNPSTHRSDSSGHGHGHGNGYAINRVHEDPSLPLEVHRRHQRNPSSSGPEKKKSQVYFSRDEYDPQSPSGTEDERSIDLEPREWEDGATRRSSRRKKDLSIGHKIEIPMGPTNSTYGNESEYVSGSKMEDPTFRAPSTMIPTPAPPIPQSHWNLPQPNDASFPGPILASDTSQDLVDPRILPPQPPYNPGFMRDGQNGS